MQVHENDIFLTPVLLTIFNLFDWIKPRWSLIELNLVSSIEILDIN